MRRPLEVSRNVRPVVRTGDVRHAVIGGVFLASQFLALNVIGLFATAYVIRRLGPLQYGQWATATALASAHLVLTNVGLRTMFVRDMARRPEHSADLLALQLALRILLGVVAALLALVLCLFLRYPPMVVSCMAVGCVWIVLSAVSSTLGDVLQSVGKFGHYSATALASGVAVTVSATAAASIGCGAMGLSVAYLVAPAMSALLYWREVSKHMPVSIRWDRTRARALLRSARLTGIGQIAAAVRDRAEQLLVPKLVGVEAFGIFSAGVMVADRLGNIPDAVCTAFYPRISRAAERTSAQPLQRTVATMLTVALAASVPVAVIATSLAESVSAILLPSALDTCRAVIRLSVWSVPLSALSLGMSFSLQAVGRHDEVARSGVRATAIAAAVSAPLIATLGITGATWSLLARPTIVAATLLPLFRRSFPAVLGSVPLPRLLLATAGLAGICLLGDRHGLWPALAFAALGTAAYGAALVALRVFPVSAVMRLFAPAAHKLAAQTES